MDVRTMLDCEKESAGVVEGFFILKTFTLRKSKNGKLFADLILSDKTGEIGGKLWEASEAFGAQYKSGDLVKVRGEVSEWRGSSQVTVKRIRPASESDGLDPADFVRTAPESFDDMYRETLTYVAAIEDESLRALVGHLLGEARDRLAYFPAAKSNHHAIRTGLLYHMLSMLRMGRRVLEVYAFLNRDLLYAGILVHDLAKLKEMASDSLGVVSDYTREGKLLGHIVQGVVDIEKAAETLGTPEETVLLLCHMVLSHHYEPEFGSPRKPMIPEAEILHHLDMIDARMYDFAEALGNTVPGGFSERVWTLGNRQLYKPENRENGDPRPDRQTQGRA